MHRIEAVAREAPTVFRQRVFRGPKDEGERSPELVADVAEEGCLGAVELGKLLAAQACFLVSACIVDGGHHLGGGQFEEGLIAVVQLPMRIHAGDHDAVGVRLVRGSEGK